MIVGVISTNQKFEILKNIIQNNCNKNEIFLININKKSIENLKTVKFDVIVLMDFLGKFDEITHIKDICKGIKYLIINSDIEQNYEFMLDVESNIITCGLNQKSTVTFSSITDEEALISIQRGIINQNKKLIDVGEYSMKMDLSNKVDLDVILISFIIQKLYK